LETADNLKKKSATFLKVSPILFYKHHDLQEPHAQISKSFKEILKISEMFWYESLQKLKMAAKKLGSYGKCLNNHSSPDIFIQAEKDQQFRCDSLLKGTFIQKTV